MSGTHSEEGGGSGGGWVSKFLLVKKKKQPGKSTAAAAEEGAFPGIRFHDLQKELKGEEAEKGGAPERLASNRAPSATVASSSHVHNPKPMTVTATTPSPRHEKKPKEESSDDDDSTRDDASPDSGVKKEVDEKDKEKDVPTTTEDKAEGSEPAAEKKEGGSKEPPVIAITPAPKSPSPVPAHLQESGERRGRSNTTGSSSGGKGGGILPRLRGTFRGFLPKDSGDSAKGVAEKAAAAANATQPPIFADRYADLPVDIQKKVLAEGLTEELVDKEWTLSTRIIKFRTRRKVYPAALANSPQDIPEEPKKTSYYLDTRFIANPQNVFTEGNPKKIYRNMHVRGQGAFGSVSQALDPEKKKVAIKVMPHVLEIDQQSNYHEISILASVKHPNICEYICSYNLESEVWVVMEYLEGGTLTDAVKRHKWKEREIAFTAKQMLKGIAYLHSQNLLHRDIKSANVMMTITGHIKLIDFGLCADVTNGPRTEMVGSPLWIPPEMVRNEPHSFKADIWSAAICLLELVNKEPPHNRMAMRCLYEVGTVGLTQPFANPDEWSESFKEFLGLMLKTDPEERASAKDLLKHDAVVKAKLSRREMQNILADAFLSETMELFNM